MSIQRYIHTVFGEMKKVEETAPTFDEGWVKNTDHERAIARLEAENERLKAAITQRESLLDKFDESIRRLRAENERLDAEIKRRDAPISDEEWSGFIIQGLGCEDVSVRYRMDALIAARAKEKVRAE